MRNRGDRRDQKAQIRKRLVEKAIRRYNHYPAGFRSDGTYVEPISKWEELPNRGYNSIRRVLRNEGKDRNRVYRCGCHCCDRCIGNLTHKYKRTQSTMAAELGSWAGRSEIADPGYGDFESTSDTDAIT